MSEACTQWVFATDVKTDRVDAVSFDNVTLDRAALVASDLLYVLSGRKFPGLCQATLRPAARPHRWNPGAWAAFLQGNYGIGGYNESWGRCDGAGSDGCYFAPQIDLGLYPVRSVSAVRIDGIPLTSAEYRLDESRILVRTRPTVSFVPTARYGWPTCQDLGLPDTQPGTFAVDLVFGADPPAAGKQAAAIMAVEFAKSWSNVSNRLPARLTSITRQGISMAVLDPMQFLAQGLTGIYEVDLFLKTYNPTGGRVRSSVWSPDMAKHRRVNNVYNPF